MPNPEIENAKRFYIWLWVGPLLLLFAAPFAYGFISPLVPWYEDWMLSFAGTSLLLGLAHSWLLVPAIVAQSEFVRWHARQALLIAAIQTLVLPASFIAGDHRSDALGYACFGGLAALIVWLVGNLRGIENAAHGDCALMRWLGHGAMLPLPVEIGIDPSMPASSRSADDLVQIIRTSPDGLARRLALGELRKLGLVEEL